MCYRIGLKLRKGIARLGRVGEAKPEGAAVEVICTRFCLCSYNSCYRFSKFGIVILSSKLSLGYSVEVWVNDDNAENRILIVSAVQFISGSTEVLSLNENLLAALRILGRSVTPRKLLRAR